MALYKRQHFIESIINRSFPVPLNPLAAGSQATFLVLQREQIQGPSISPRVHCVWCTGLCCSRTLVVDTCELHSARTRTSPKPNTQGPCIRDATTTCSALGHDCGMRPWVCHDVRSFFLNFLLFP
ncbi:hypothetical protein BT67DRAFT_301439 [Trichocladium antarcticum]|uniref:Uncharacterized protein n=1 Tax=Trichocladium antarcticum TaxID=1450529 RepID=A0AAN6UKG0_9PEZI|nr:hypothetical protein BT67DRAFT_301439 [Trichocladium antarcticum]